MADQNNELQTSTWKLPKGKMFTAVSWGFVVEQLEYLINPLVEEEGKVNTAIQRIIDKVDSWLEEE
jgi:hypothetical protein